VIGLELAVGFLRVNERAKISYPTPDRLSAWLCIVSFCLSVCLSVKTHHHWV